MEAIELFAGAGASPAHATMAGCDGAWTANHGQSPL